MLLAVALTLAGCSDGAFATFNDVPGASILAPEDASVFREGELIELRGFADDNRTRAADLLVSWSSSIEGQLFEGAPGSDGTTSLDLVLEELGEHVITLRVVDPRGGVGSDTVTITVLENQAPQPLIIAPTTEGIYHSDIPVTLIGGVSDNEDLAGELRVSWTLDDVVVVDDQLADDAGYTSHVASLDEGAHTASLRVQDTEGKSASATVSFVVRGPNNPPQCSLDLPVPGAEFTQGEIISFVGTATDADVPSSALAVEWLSSADGVLGSSVPSDSGTVTFDTASVSGGTPTVTMVVTDEVGVTCSDSVQLTIESPPTVQIIAPVGGATTALGAPVLLQSQVADIQDAPTDLLIMWSSSVDGNVAPDVADSSGFQTGNSSGLSAATHTLTVTVTDTAGLTGSASVTHTVSAPPSEPVVEITPNPATSADDLGAALTTPSVDPEGDPITYAWEWTRDSVPQPTYSGSPTVPSTATSQGDVWEVTVTPSDPWSTGPSASASILVGNGAPSATTPSLTPSTLYTNTTTYCTGSTGSDPDGDPVTLLFSWEVNGSALPFPNNVLGGNWFDKGDTVECFVTPDDGFTLGQPMGSGGHVVLNSVPTAPTVAISPSAPDPVDDLTCALVAPSTDLDPGDNVTHVWTWYANGALAPVTGPTVPASMTADQDLWTCEVTATDGTATGPAGSATATVCQNETWYEDNDGDGYGDFATEVVACASPPGFVPEAGDCDDTDPNAYPTAGDTATDSVDTDCDGMDCEAADFNGTYYTVCLDNGDWFDAETACISAGYDGLATFVSAAEETFVVNLLIASGGSNNQDPWIGLTDQGSPGTFQWTDGSPVSYQNWDTGQPDSGGSGNDCAVLTVSGGGAAAWDDITCTQGSPGWTSYACSQR